MKNLINKLEVPLEYTATTGRSFEGVAGQILLAGTHALGKHNGLISEKLFLRYLDRDSPHALQHFSSGHSRGAFLLVLQRHGFSRGSRQQER